MNRFSEHQKEPVPKVAPCRDGLQERPFATEPDSPGYTLVNWYLDYAVTRNLSLHTGIENIGNERLANDDPDDYDRVDPGRRYFAGLTVSF